MTDLPPAAAGQDQVVPFTHARGATVAFLLDCIAEAEKRKAAGIFPPPDGPAPAATMDEDEDEADDSDTDDDVDGVIDVVNQTPPLSDGNPLSPPPAPLPVKGPAQTAPAYSGLPSGRQQRNRAKAAIFQGVPKLPRLCKTAESIERSETLLPTQPPEEDEWGPPDWAPTPWGGKAVSAANEGGGDNDHGTSSGDSEGGTESSSNASKASTPRAASPAPSTAQSTTSFATAVTGVTPMVVDDTFETASESTATPTPQPELHAPTFEEVLEVMVAFELDSLKYVVFDALKLSRAAHLADTTQPGPALSAEYLYAFACRYQIGNKSYWATRCLASAWHKGLVPGAEPLDRPRVRFSDLDAYPLSKIEPSDFEALKDMFGRFNRSFSIFVSNFAGTPRSDTNTRFGRACKTCPIKTEHETWQKFKRALLREHVAPLVITAPQFMRKRHFLTDTLRQFIDCTRCADRIIHMCLNLWKRVQPDAWSFNPRKRGRKTRFARKPKVHHVWNHTSHAAAAAAAAAAHQQAQLAHQQAQQIHQQAQQVHQQAQQIHQQAQQNHQQAQQAHQHSQNAQGAPQHAQQQAANLNTAFANAGISATTTATATGYSTVWQIPATTPGGPMHLQMWTSSPPTFTVSNTAATNAAGTNTAANTAGNAPPAMPAPAAAPAAPPAQAPAPAVAPAATATQASSWNAPPTNSGWGAPAPPPAPASAPPATNAAGSGWGHHNSGWGNSGSTDGWGNSDWGSHTSTAHAAHASSGWGASSASGWGSATNSSNAATGSSNTATGSDTYQGWGAPPAGSSSNAQNDGW